MRPTPIRAASLTALLAALLLTSCSRHDAAPEPVRAVRTMIVSTGSTTGRHEYAAEVRARTETRLGFRVGGKIASRNVDLGDDVKVGQVIARLDPQDLKLSQDAARAALAVAQVNHAQAAADFRRFRELKDQGFISAAELERRETALKAAQASLEQARAQSSFQGNQAAHSTLVADAPGVITAVEGEPGMVVAAGATVVRLAQDGPRDVVFAVPEDKVGLLRTVGAAPGALSVRLWSGGDPLPARLREVAAAADPATRTFLAKADVGGAAVKLGQTATVLLELPSVPGLTRLPLEAVVRYRGKTVAWLLDEATMTVRPQAIEVGGADANSVVVAAGLNPGQVVVTAGVHTLTDGQKVKPYVEPAAPVRASGSASAVAR
jgi:membrane fusion protein, multidrug efflux system